MDTYRLLEKIYFLALEQKKQKNEEEKKNKERDKDKEEITIAPFVFNENIFVIKKKWKVFWVEQYSIEIFTNNNNNK